MMSSAGLFPIGELQDLERAAERRERIAQLVGERGEELVLAAIGFAQGLGRLAVHRRRSQERPDPHEQLP